MRGSHRESLGSVRGGRRIGSVQIGPFAAGCAHAYLLRRRADHGVRMVASDAAGICAVLAPMRRVDVPTADQLACVEEAAHELRTRLATQPIEFHVFDRAAGELPQRFACVAAVERRKGAKALGEGLFEE